MSTDVNELLQRLRMSSNGAAPNTSNRAPSFSGLQQPQAHSPGIPSSLYNITSPPPPPPGLTNVAASSDRATADRTANLLNLLKFNQPTQPVGGPAQVSSASGVRSENPASAAPSNTSEALLKLLNRSTPSASRAPSTNVPIKQEPVLDVPEPNNGKIELAAEPAAKKPVFTYINPFDDLAASAPTNAIAAAAAAEPEIQFAIAQELSKTPTPLPDGRSQVEALLGIGSKKAGEPETVTSALQEAGQQASQEATDAVERAESSLAKAKENDTDMLEHALVEAAVEMREDLKDPEVRAAMEADMPPAMAKGFEDTIDKVAKGADVLDSWETAAVAESAKEPVFVQFPMRPFTAIDIQTGSPKAAGVKDDIVMKISSMKREFDQVDRTLAAATTSHIVYAMTNKGGFRVIRQDDGSNKHVFKKPNGPQVFNIGITESNVTRTDSILATAVNGTVYWTEVPMINTEAFAELNVDDHGFQLPPVPSQEDSNTSGGQLKTRAKLSCRHPEFFALGRGKSIYIVWPQVAMRTRYCETQSRVVDSEKYFSERSLKIATGKAGKDFAFSQDDTVLASLDKAGRVKFWDIKEHTDRSVVTQESPIRPVDLKVPLMVLETSQPEKSWATSVQFIDKERPFNKGYALRYLLVGSRQNHTLTLWDLSLNKAVQELNFPHAHETDPICSISYNATAGVIAVGHPTRNSVYLLQLSAPKYNLSGMSQAEYIARLSRSDRELPPTASTAIMSGFREISLDGLGTLRSLELNGPIGSDDGSADQKRALELYIMHSKGVTCLNLEKQDIGVSEEDGRPVNAVDGQKEKYLIAHEFDAGEQPQRSERSETSSNAKPSPAAQALPRGREAEGTPSKPVNGSSAKMQPAPIANKPAVNTQSSKASSAATFASIAKAAEKTFPEPAVPAKKAVSPVRAPTPAKMPTPARTPTPAKTPVPAEASISATAATTKQQEAAPVQAVAEQSASQEFGPVQISNLSQSISQAMGGVLSEVFSSVLSDQLDKLYRRIDADKRVQEATNAANQDAILRLVSSTLTDNVDKSLTAIVNKNIKDQVVPAVNKVVAQSVEKKVAESLTSQVNNVVPKELKHALTPAIGRAMQEPETLRIVADLVSSKISSHVENVFAKTLKETITPSFSKLAVDSAQRATSDIDSRVRTQLQAFEMQKASDTTKIDQLTALTSDLLRTVRTMAGTQNELQDQILTLRTEFTAYQAQALAAAEASAAATAAQAVPAIKQEAQEPQDPELAAIADLMNSGRAEEATIKWLQSPNQASLFDSYFRTLSPAYLPECNQIVILSVAAAVTATLSSHLAERLTWLETALGALDPPSGEIREHAGSVMDALTARLQEAYMSVAEVEPGSSLLPRVHRLVRRAREVKGLAA